MGTFKVDATRFYWVSDDGDNPTDICLHGHVVAYFDDVMIEDDCTVSAAALRLLRTLTEDHIYHKDIDHLLPCCGFFVLADDDMQNVYIDGCCYGTDWSVLQKDGHFKIILEDGYTTCITAEDYRAEVFRFADSVAAYYASCKTKALPTDDELIHNGWLAFRNEWNRRRHPQ